MTTGFQCYYDAFGNLWVRDGMVIQPANDVFIFVGSGAFRGVPTGPRYGAPFQTLKASEGANFVGGSGRNISITGLPPSLSGDPVPVGWFLPGMPDEFIGSIFTLTVTGSSAAVINDGTDDVAILTTGGLAPAGGYASTAYGETTYNGGTPFTLTAVKEGGWPGTIPQLETSVNAGTAMAGKFTAADTANFTSDDDADWTWVMNSDGSADIFYLTDIVASRASGSVLDPAGAYEATAFGMETFNLTDDEPVVGEAFTMHVRVLGQQPRAGYAYLEIVEVDGVLSAVNGPFYGTLPSAFDETVYMPLAQFDGASGEQYHTGSIVLPAMIPGPAGTGLTWVSLTMEDYDALDPIDPDTIYDITDAPWSS